MRNSGKIVLAFLMLAILGVGACFVGFNWNAIKAGIQGYQLYTYEDVEKAYDDGYYDAGTNEIYYKELVETMRVQIDDYKLQVNNLTETNNNYKKNNEALQLQKENLELQVSNLTQIKNENQATIETLNAQIVDFKNQIKLLEASEEDKTQQITFLNQQVSSLQQMVSSLQSANDVNLATISSLQNQIKSLNVQIDDLALQMQSSANTVSALNKKIEELEKSVAYYEEYLKTLENGEQVVATFEFDGSVYNIQVVNKNAIISVTEPTSTEYVIFNGWKVGEEFVDLSSYPITKNTKFVADITYKYDVVFKVDNEEYNKQIVVKDNFAVEPEAPTKENSTFKGWSADGKNVINVASYEITGNTTFVALFELNTCDVSFMVEEEAYRTESVTYGSYANIPTPPTKEHYVFKGWSMNGTDIVDVASYKIVKDTTFIAVFEIKTYTVSFMANDTECDNQVIAYGNFATEPEAPTKENYIFKGWSINGIDVVDVASYEITGNTTFVALFEKVYKLTFMSNGVQHATLDYSEMNKNINVSDPTLKYYNFIGWSINGTDIIDVASYKIVEDTTFVAVFDTEYTDEEICNFVLNEMVDGMLDLSNTLIHTIPLGMFANNKNIVSVVLPNTVITIGLNAFYSCSNLQSVTLSTNLNKICSNAFADCRSLKSIYIPKSVEFIVGVDPNNPFAFDPFILCSDDFQIYCEATEKQEGWSDSWNIADFENKYYAVHYGYSYEQYLEAIKEL